MLQVQFPFKSLPENPLKRKGLLSVQVRTLPLLPFSLLSFPSEEIQCPREEEKMDN